METTHHFCLFSHPNTSLVPQQTAKIIFLYLLCLHIRGIVIVSVGRHAISNLQLAACLGVKLTCLCLFILLCITFQWCRTGHISVICDNLIACGYKKNCRIFNIQTFNHEKWWAKVRCYLSLLFWGISLLTWTFWCNTTLWPGLELGQLFSVLLSNHSNWNTVSKFLQTATVCRMSGKDYLPM